MTASGENDRTDSGPGTSDADTAQPQPDSQPVDPKNSQPVDLVSRYDDERLSSEGEADMG